MENTLLVVLSPVRVSSFRGSLLELPHAVSHLLGQGEEGLDIGRAAWHRNNGQTGDFALGLTLLKSIPVRCYRFDL